MLANPSAIFFFLSHANWAEPIANLFAALDNYMVYVMHQLDAAIAARAAAAAAAAGAAGVNNTNTTNTTAAAESAATDNSVNATATDAPAAGVVLTRTKTGLWASSSQQQRTVAFHDMVERHRTFARDFMPFMHAASVRLTTVMRETESGNGSLSVLPSDAVIGHVVDEALLFSTSTSTSTSVTSHSSSTTKTPQGRRLLVANGTQDWKQQLGTIPMTEAIGFVQVLLVSPALSANQITDSEKG